MSDGHPTRQCRVRVDLAGSNCGPGWRSVELLLEPPAAWDAQRVRDEAAGYYEVPIAQVGEVRWA